MPIINGGVCVVNGKPVDKVYSNGIQVYGRNLIQMENITAGYVISDGTIAPANSELERVTDFIEVEPNQTYWIQDKVDLLKGQRLWFGVGIYNGNKTIIYRPSFAGTPVVSDVTDFYNSKMEMPNNAKYVRVSFSTFGRKGSFKFEKSETATPWTPAPEDVGVTD